eukprot:scaffold84544_cov63-Phaeocystis_antarctica.AAC.1
MVSAAWVLGAGSDLLLARTSKHSITTDHRARARPAARPLGANLTVGPVCSAVCVVSRTLAG